MGPVPDGQRALDASLPRRLEAATKRNQQQEAENRELRKALALTLGAPPTCRSDTATCRRSIITATLGVDLKGEATLSWRAT